MQTVRFENMIGETTTGLVIVYNSINEAKKAHRNEGGRTCKTREEWINARGVSPDSGRVMAWAQFQQYLGHTDVRTDLTWGSRVVARGRNHHRPGARMLRKVPERRQITWTNNDKKMLAV